MKSIKLNISIPLENDSNSGWTYDFYFLRKIKELMDYNNSDCTYSINEEHIENLIKSLISIGDKSNES